MIHDGRCHCGNLTVRFDSAQEPGRIGLRVCGCTFCRKHAATWVSDPAGALEISVSDAARLSRYQFGRKTSEFLVCATCGVHVAAVATIDGATYASLNCNVLDDRPAFTQPPRPVDFEDEPLADRVTRRRRGWTPAKVHGV